MELPRLEGFRVVEELGRGGQGSVHRVVEQATGVERAVKVLDGHTDPVSVERFRREANALARLGGRGVVAVHSTGVEGNRLYFVMDLMRGGSLDRRLRDRGPLAWREAGLLVAKLARTLERAHAAGLVHRDLKPANILFDDTGEPRVTDFGCVRDLNLSALTESGSVLGTPAYMAPEQLEGRAVAAPADVFALGVLLQELVTGARPFGGTNPARLFLTMKEGKRARVAPPELDALLDRVLAFDPSDRPSAAALAAALERLAKGEPGRARPWWALAAAACGLVALVIVSARSPTQGPVKADSVAPPRSAHASAPPVPPSAPPPEELAREAEERLDQLDWKGAKELAQRALEAPKKPPRALVVLSKVRVLEGAAKPKDELALPENLEFADELRRYFDAVQGGGEKGAPIVSTTTMRLAMAEGNDLEYGLLLMRRGRAWMMGGQPQKAIEDYTQAIALAQRLGLSVMEGEGLWRRGLVWQRMDNVDDALGDFTASIKRNDTAQSRLDRARAYLARHDRESARNDLDACVRLSRDDLGKADRLKEIGEAYALAGDEKNATKFLELAGVKAALPK